jgi:hypothetical protein
MFAIGPESGASSANVGDRDAHIAKRNAHKGSQLLIRIIRVLFIVNRPPPGRYTGDGANSKSKSIYPAILGKSPQAGLN